MLLQQIPLILLSCYLEKENLKVGSGLDMITLHLTIREVLRSFTSQTIDVSGTIPAALLLIFQHADVRHGQLFIFNQRIPTFAASLNQDTQGSVFMCHL